MNTKLRKQNELLKFNKLKARHVNRSEAEAVEDYDYFKSLDSARESREIENTIGRYL
jgi:hypothetical protein